MHNRPLIISLLGDKGVGKSSLLTSFSDKEFDIKYYETIGIDVCIRTIDVDHVPQKLQILDLSGHRRFESLWCGQILKSEIVIISFDLTNRSSWESVPGYIRLAQSTKDNLMFMLVATKADLKSKRVIEQEEIDSFIDGKAPFIQAYWETSAKEHGYLRDVFEMCVRMYRIQYNINHELVESDTDDEETAYRKTIYGMLSEYDQYIRDNIFNDSRQPDYQFGFLLMAGSRGLNRIATYMLITSLMEDVMNPSVALGTMFRDLEMKRKRLISRHKLDTSPDYVERSITSTLANSIFARIDNLLHAPRGHDVDAAPLLHK